MTVNKRTKKSRYRGSMTHGWGSKKKHRGHGNRGGKGMAGTGKRGDAKKPSIWKNLNTYFGRHGFKKKNKVIKKSINVGYFETHLDTLKNKGLAKDNGGVIEVNTNDLGYNKLLGAGKITKKFKITTDFAVKGVADKLKAAGGELVLLKEKRLHVKKTKEKKKSEDESEDEK